jgi:hypothetical protein
MRFKNIFGIYRDGGRGVKREGMSEGVVYNLSSLK